MKEIKQIIIQTYQENGFLVAFFVLFFGVFFGVLIGTITWYVFLLILGWVFNFSVTFFQAMLVSIIYAIVRNILIR